jgi:hypothetical protein
MSNQKRTYFNGDRYEGELQGEIRNRRGTYYFTNRNRYEGNWRNN